MRYSSILTVSALAALTLIARSTFGESPSIERVRAAVAAQEAWLGSSSGAAGWNKYLLTSELKEQLQAGDKADPAVVRKVLQRYEAPQPGLKLTKFVSTRKALTDWSDELSLPPREKLPEMVRGAKGSYQSVPKADVLSRQVAAEAAARRLDRYLKGAGRSGEGWREYLQLDKLQAEVKKGIEARPDMLKAYRARFVSGIEGLELPQFAGMATALQSYADALGAYQQAEGNKQFDQDVDSLAAFLDTAVQKPNDLDRSKMSEVVGRLMASGQARELISSVWKRFSEPNLRVQASSYVVTAGIADDIDEDTPIKDVIMGTRISGKGRTRGVVSGALVPNYDQAQLGINMRGTTTSRNVGRNGPATVFSSATTSLYADKNVFIDAEGFTASRAAAKCKTNSRIDNININGGRMVQRVGTERVYEQAPVTKEIATRHAEDRLEKRMDDRTGNLLANTNQTYNDKFRNPLLRRAAFPQRLDFSTSPEWLTVVGLQARAGELGASTPPPEVAGDAQLSIRAHESLVENLAEVLMSGRTARDEDFRRFSRNMDGRKLKQDDMKVLLRNLRDGVETYKDFSGLLKDRLEKEISEKQFDALVREINDKQLSAERYDEFLKGLAAEPAGTDEANAMLRDLPDPSQGSLTFTDTHPVSVHFRNDVVKITLHSTGHTSRTGVERQIPMDISASYKFDWHGGKLVSKRQGEIEVSPPNHKSGERLTNEQTIARGTLRSRFEEIFKPEMESSGLTLRGRWKKLGELPWTQFVVKDGWVAAGWKVAEGQSSAGGRTPSDKSITAN